MTIETKYSIGDNVFRMEKNAVESLEIKGLRAQVRSNGDALPSIDVYCIFGIKDPRSHDAPLEIHEDWLFPSKEALLKSL